jgi:preprotein translocase subunit SecG
MEHLKIQLSLSLPFPEWASAGRFLSQRLYNQQTALHIPALMWLSILIPIMLSILVIVCVLLTLVVLMQRPKNEGLGAAFGSSMTENIFGAQTATVLTKATVYLGCIFFGVTLVLTVLTARQSMDRRVGVLENEVRKAAVAATPKTIASPAASGSPQATASIAGSATPATSATPVSSSSPGPSASASPSPSVATESSPAPSPSAVTESSPAPSPSAATETSPGPSPSVGQGSPAPSASP